MKKNKYPCSLAWIKKLNAQLKKTFNVLILTLVVLLGSTFNAYSQDQAITLNLSQVQLDKIFEEIAIQSKLKFIYKSGDVNDGKMKDINVENKPLKEVMENLLSGTELNYKILGDKVVIMGKVKAGQNFVVKGKVVDGSGEAIPGVNVIVQGTTKGTLTDIEGKFEITVPSESNIIQISSMGYKNEEFVILEDKTLEVILKEDVVGLDEVVVTALGIKKEKKALGYAVSEVKSEVITRSAEANVLNALNGKVAGMQITQSGISSTGSSNIVLRGNSSIQGNNTALIVVDGVIYDNGGGYSGGIDRGQGIGDLNTSDIASVTVLKGANASALYGSKGQNGVLVITTKKKVKNKGIGLSYKTGLTFREAFVWPELQNVYGQGKSDVGQFHGIGKDGIPFIGGGSRDESWGPKMEGQDVRVHWLRDKPIRKFSPQPDNIKDFFQTGVTKSHALSLSFASDKATYYASLLYDDIDEIVEESNVKRYGGSLRVTQKVTDRIDVDFKLSYTETKANQRIAVGSGIDFENMITGPRSYYDSDLRKVAYPASGKIWGGGQEDGHPVIWSTTTWTGNPYWALYKDKNRDTRRRLVGALKLNYNIWDNLNFMIRHGFDQTNTADHTTKAINSRYTYETGRYSHGKGFGRIYTTDFLFSYQKKFFKDFDFGLTAGGSQYREEWNGTGLSGTGFASEEEHKLNYATTKGFSYGESQKTINALYGNLNLGYKDFLFGDFSYRNDWSSTLNPDNNSYGYYSATGSFVFTELMPKNDWLSFGKVRYSYATVGNDTSPYAINSVYGVGVGTKGEKSQWNPGGKPFWDLKPERTFSHELGADLRFLQGRLNIDFTYYKSNTEDQIIPGQPLASSSGYGSKMLNAGDVENKGIELMINAIPYQNKDIRWNVGFTFSKNESKVLSLPEGLDEITLATGRGCRLVVREGNKYATLEGRGFKRNDAGLIIVQSSGSFKGAPKYPGETDLIELGSPEPDWTGSFNTSVSYKGFTLGAQIDASIGGEVIAITNFAVDEQGTSKRSLDGRAGWIRSEEERKAAGKSSDEWTPTGGVSTLWGKSVFEDPSLVNEDGVQVGGVLNQGSDAVYAKPDKYHDSFHYGKIAEYNLEDASYIKLRELSLSYQFPKEWIKPLNLTGVSLGFVGRNLMIIDKETTHFDPELYSMNARSNGARGIEDGFLPATRTFSFNLKINL